MKKIIMIAVPIVLVLVIGVIAVFVLKSGGEDKVKEIEYFEYALDEDYSNLRDDSNAIVKYGIIIQYTGDDTLELLEKNKNKIANFIDEIMRNTTTEEIKEPNGKEKLRTKIQDRVISELETDNTIITDIFIRPFVVQG